MEGGCHVLAARVTDHGRRPQLGEERQKEVSTKGSSKSLAIEAVRMALSCCANDSAA